MNEGRGILGKSFQSVSTSTSWNKNNNTTNETDMQLRLDFSKQ